MPLILGTNSIKDTGYNVANSCRFNDGDSPYLSRNMSSQGSSIKGSFSAWIKWSSHTSDKCLMTHYYNNNYFFSIHSQDDNTFMVKDYRTSNIMVYYTSAVYRDLSSWYNFVVIVDRSLGTANDRVKIFINGTRLTSANSGLTVGAAYDQQTSGSHSGNHSMNNDYTLEVGRNQALNGDGYMDGYIAEMVWLDGVAKAVTDFGEFDEDSPTIWKPKDVSGLSSEKGTNGFWLDFKDSSNLGNCAFGGTDFSENNIAATDQSTDTCTNNFATINPFHFGSTIATSYSNLTEGNCLFTSTQDGSPYPYYFSTMAASKGKWYAEFKRVSSTVMIGIASGTADSFLGGTASARGYAMYQSGQVFTDGSGSGYGDAMDDNDIIGVAMDLDNNKLYFSNQGVFQNSGDPTSGSTGTGAYSIEPPASNGTGVYHFAVGDAGGGSPVIQCNFGNPIVALSSGNSDANGYGNFEYAVPSGYYSLNSKNLAEFG